MAVIIAISELDSQLRPTIAQRSESEWPILQTMNPSGDATLQRRDDVNRIREALAASRSLLVKFRPSGVCAEIKAGGDPVTAADRAVNDLLFQMLPRDGEGWLSEESADNPARLKKSRVWVVDPLDGTKEFIAGIPEWCVSIGLVENGLPVAGGICNPSTGETIFGCVESGVTVRTDNREVQLENSQGVGKKPSVLASRSETNRGEWESLKDSPFSIRPMGSVAYKLALVAAGLADATWTLVPKNEWDVAGGTALVLASGGLVTTLDGRPPVFNQPKPLLKGLVALSANGRQFSSVVSSLTGVPLVGDCH